MNESLFSMQREALLSKAAVFNTQRNIEIKWYSTSH
jgi:hypothetical protein